MVPDEWAGGRPDADLETVVTRRLESHVGWRRWRVHADRGHVLLCDDFDDPVDQHVAGLVAGTVPGVVSVDTALRSRCPRHTVLPITEGPSALVGPSGDTEDWCPRVRLGP